MSEKKQSQAQKKQCDHVYIATKYTSAGGKIVACEVRCSKCLHLVNLEKLQWVEESE